MNKNKRINTIILISGLLCIVLNSILLPYFYPSNRIVQLLITTSGNWCGVIVASYILFQFLNPKNKPFHYVAIAAAIGFIIYEFLQLLIPNRIFDIYDIIATAIGCIISILIYKFTHRKK